MATVVHLNHQRKPRRVNVGIVTLHHGIIVTIYPNVSSYCTVEYVVG
jgi:hypothetical protein